MALKKYWSIAKEAYRREKEIAVSKVSIEQKEFLPAALEVLEQPASPLGRFSIWFLCVFFVIALSWSIIGKVDVIAIASGKLAPVGQTKIVQSFEVGVVRKIFVQDGSFVEQGDSLLVLDTTVNNADMESLKRQWRIETLNKERLSWLFDGSNKGISLSYEGPRFSPELNDTDLERLSSLSISQLEEFRANSLGYDERINEKLAEIEVSLGELSKLNATVPLLEERVQKLKNLSADGVSSRFEYLEYQEELITRERDIDIIHDRVKQIEANIRTLALQKNSYRQEFIAETLSNLMAASDKLIAIEQELIKLRQSEALHNVKAPISGFVQQLAINTEGGVVNTGDALLAIVPTNGTLQVEANILNKDIGFVDEGQAVEIKLESFPFTKYGVIAGKIISINVDAVLDESLGLIYPCRVELSAQSLTIHDKVIALSPGMVATVEVKTGKRRIIEFILAPLFRYKQESLRER